MSGYVGHTSPHSRDVVSENFSRPDKDGNIRPVSLIPLEKASQQTLLSGTVYYMVFERDDRDPQDPWGTGIPNFMKTFRAGIDFNGGSSPNLDPRSKYLYLYQVVNHQRTIPPIESMSTKLLVELSEITSWGYFHGLGFASRDADDVVRPLSATHKVDPRTYLSPAPALSIAQPLSLAIVPTSRGEVEPMRDANKGKIVQVHWDALDPATPPDYVMILGSSDFDKHPSFRAIWSGKNAIGKDGRSTVFGFTSPMPPTIEPVRLRTSREAAKEAGAVEADGRAKDDKIQPVTNKATEAVKFARMAEDEGTTVGASIPGVEGRVPTPFPTSAGLAFNPDKDSKASSNSGAGLPLASMPPPTATSSPSLGGGGFGGGNTSSSPSGGGGGLGGGFGGGSGGTFVQIPNRGQGSSTATSSSTVVNNINFNVSQSNQQSQSQYQYQNQSQSQNQNQSGGGGGHGNVVPEPASIIGLALGLPALVVAYRRRRRAS